MLKRPKALFLTLFLLAAPLATPAEEPAKASKAQPDHSQEAFVFEQYSSKQQFENDGTATEENTGKVRIQSEVGAQRYGVLSFSYASGTGTFEVNYVRVHKPDGSVVETPADNIQDMTAEITRQAPFYSDLHEKHVAVKGWAWAMCLSTRPANTPPSLWLPGSSGPPTSSRKRASFSTNS